MTPPTTSPQRNLEKLRPTERVEHFLKAEILRSSTTGDRLPTIKQISTLLGVGISTVQSTFARFSKEGRLITIPGKGTYVAETGNPPQANGQRIVTVSIHENQLTGPESTWGKEICAGILRETTTGELKMVMRPFFIDQNDVEAKVEAELNDSSAAIVFPSEFNRKLVSAFHSRGKPVIFIVPPSITSTVNFVTPNFYQAARRLAECWRETGRQHVALIMHHPLIENTTSAFSLAGLQAELQAVPSCVAPPVKLSHFSVADRSASLEPLLSTLFDGPHPPDAIHATDDRLAARIVQWLLENEIDVPERVSVTGGTGLHPMRGAHLPCSVIEQPFEAIGRGAVEMIRHILHNDNAPQPGRFIDTTFRAGATTREVENQFFSQAGRPPAS